VRQPIPSSGTALTHDARPRSKDGKLQHSVVTPDQARLLLRAIGNFRKIQALLARWEEGDGAQKFSTRKLRDVSK